MLLAENTYNELGQLIDKGMGSVGESPFLQSVDYRYNIMGWLTYINNSTLTNDSNFTNDESNDFFGMELLYENNTLGNFLGINADYFNNIFDVSPRFAAYSFSAPVMP